MDNIQWLSNYMYLHIHFSEVMSLEILFLIINFVHHNFWEWPLSKLFICVLFILVIMKGNYIKLYFFLIDSFSDLLSWNPGESVSRFQENNLTLYMKWSNIYCKSTLWYTCNLRLIWLIWFLHFLIFIFLSGLLSFLNTTYFYICHLVTL